MEYDLVVIGGGPGGYVAAIRAAQLGMRTALIEREHLGGICLNWGCIPTKALLRTSELYRQIKEAEAFGLLVDGVGFDFERLIQRSRAVADKLSSGVAFLMKKNKITVFDASARLEGPGRVALTAKDGAILPSVTAKHIVIATGARARSLPGLEPDGVRIWTYKEAMVPPSLPKSLLVIGSGAIGIEFASFYRALGVEVTVVEVQNRILPVEDEEISKLAHKAFAKQGITIHTGATVEHLQHTDAGGVSARLRIADGNTSVYAQYSLLVRNRDAVQAFLSKRGVPSSVHYPVPLNRQPAMADGDCHLPVCEDVSARVLSIPMHPYLEERAQARVVDAVIDAVKSV